MEPAVVTLSSLWLPILLAAVAVFVVSSVVHMALPIHKSDMKGMPQEDSVLDALRKAGLGAGEYFFPWSGSMAAMNSPEYKDKLARGPVGGMVIRAPGGFSMGRSLLQWMLFCLFVSAMVAYLMSISLPAASPKALQFASAAAFVAYAPSNVHNSVWKGVCWSTAWKFAFDGLLYSLATGFVFAWLWPQA